MRTGRERMHAPSCLPSLLLPCLRYGQRMEMTAVEPMSGLDGDQSNDLEDVTYHCVHCGTILIRTMQPLYS